MSVECGDGRSLFRKLLNEHSDRFTPSPSPSRAPVVARDPLRAASQRWHLTARQTQVLNWIAHGLTNVLIAETLGITEGTVEFHVKSIFDKAGVESRAMLIVKMLEG